MRLVFYTEVQEGVLDLSYEYQTRTRSYVLAHTNISNFKRAQSSPHHRMRLIFYIEVQEGVLNLSYEDQTRTRSYVLAHTTPLVKLVLRPHPSEQVRQTTSYFIGGVGPIQSNAQTNRTHSYVLDPFSSLSTWLMTPEP